MATKEPIEEPIEEPAKEPAKEPIEEPIIPWRPNMFKGAGLINMPTLVGWEAGINSLDLFEDMKRNPFYSYDNKVKAWRRI